MRGKILALLVILGLLAISILTLAAPPQNYSLHYEFKNPDGSVFRLAKCHLLNAAQFRTEISTPDGANLLTEIYRQDKEVVWTIDAAASQYFEDPLAPDEWNALIAGIVPTDLTGYTKTGETRLLAIACDIYESGEDGTKITLYLAQGSGVVLRCEIRQDNEIAQIMDATLFETTAPAASLFEIPAGYTKGATE